MRALGWSIFPIPINRIDDVYFTGLLERFTKYKLEESNGLTFIQFQISSTTTIEQKNQIDKKLIDLKDKVEGDYDFSLLGWVPRFWETRSILEADNAICGKVQIDSTYSNVEIKESFVKFKTNKLPFNFNDIFHSIVSHKVNLSFNYFDKYADKAGLIYGIETIDWIKLTHSYGRDKWRLSKTGLNYFVRHQNDEIHFYIPKAKEFFNIYFSKYGNSLKETSNGRLAYEVLRNIGGITGTDFLQNKSSLKILELVEDGKTVSYSQLIGEIKKSLRINNNKKVEFYLKKLLNNKIIEFGSIIQCEVCYQRTFYLPTEIKEVMTCSVCRNNFGLPMHKPNEIKWSYRGIGPFSKNNKVGGIMAVFLTLKLFSEEFSDTSGNMSALIGFELFKNSTKKEVDLAVMLQEKRKDSIPPDLIFCECKTLKDFTSKDADRMIELGNEFPNSILTFATLKEELLIEEKAEILKVVTHFRTGIGKRPTNPVLILTSKELLPDYFVDPLLEYKEDSKPYYLYNDLIGNLCELSIKKHLGLKTWGEIRGELWQEEMRKRNEKNAPQQGFSVIGGES